MTCPRLVDGRAGDLAGAFKTCKDIGRRSRWRGPLAHLAILTKSRLRGTMRVRSTALPRSSPRRHRHPSYPHSGRAPKRQDPSSEVEEGSAEGGHRSSDERRAQAPRRLSEQVQLDQQALEVVVSQREGRAGTKPAERTRSATAEPLSKHREAHSIVDLLIRAGKSCSAV